MEIILRIQVNATCFAVLAVIAFSVEGSKRGLSAERLLDIIIFRGMVHSTLVMILLDTLGWVLDGVPGDVSRMVLILGNALCLGLYPVPTALYVLYADFQVYRDPGRIRRSLPFLGGIALPVILLALASPFTGWLFQIDEANLFLRGPAFPFLAVAVSCLVIWSFVVVIAGRKKVSRTVLWTLLAYPIPVTVAAMARYLSYGLVLVWPVTTVFLVTAAFNIQRRRASIDHLTGVANRRSLDEELERFVDGGRSARGFGGIMVDLDEFKSINDRFGHEAGDRALEDASSILRSALRSGDLVARYGGDEFVILLPNATAVSLAEIVRRIKHRVELHNRSNERPYRLAFSMGAALYDPKIDGSAQRFLSKLDTSMYKDKAAHKSAVVS